MPANVPKASEGGGDRGRTTPRKELARIRETQTAADSEAHERIMEAMLCACGEKGYREVSVREVIERCGGHRVQFYERFASKADCYAAAYATHAGALCEEMLDAAAAEPSWHEGLIAALQALARFVARQPALARGIVIEVHVAGGAALVRREELFERLSHAVDSARRETGSRHSPPPETAAFMVGAIDAALVSALTKGAAEKFAVEAAPELAWMASAAFFDEETATQARTSLLRS